MMEEQIKSEFCKLSELFLEMRQPVGPIRQAAETCLQALRAGKKLFFCGNSPNVVEAVVRDKKKGLRTVGLTSSGGGRLAELCNLIESAGDHDKSTLS